MRDDLIDLYCERVGPGLWNEPLNAVTNLAFIAAGLLLVIALRRADPALRRDPAIVALVALLFVIGLGSGLFHTFATFWAMLADVVPIAVFILLYMYLALRRLIALPLWGCLLGVAVVLVLVVALPVLFGFSVSTYGVALAAMLGVGGFLHFGRRHPAGAPILVAAGVFAVAPNPARSTKTTTRRRRGGPRTASSSPSASFATTRTTRAMTPRASRAAKTSSRCA